MKMLEKTLDTAPELTDAFQTDRRLTCVIPEVLHGSDAAPKGDDGSLRGCTGRAF